LAFLAVDRPVEHLTAWPDAGTMVPGVSADLPIRKMPADGFPYYLAYVVASDAVRVLAVAYDRRRPGYWQPRT
jgi:plasmid stabilization system protein ParE